MKIFARIVSFLMAGVMMVGMLTSCGENSLRPHDALEPIYACRICRKYDGIICKIYR